MPRSKGEKGISFDGGRDMKKKLKEYCLKNDISVSQLLRRLVNEFFDRSAQEIK